MRTTRALISFFNNDYVTPFTTVFTVGTVLSTYFVYQFLNEQYPNNCEVDGLLSCLASKAFNMVLSLPVGVALGFTTATATIPCGMEVKNCERKIENDNREYERSITAPLEDEENGLAPVSNLEMSNLGTYQGAHVSFWENKQNNDERDNKIQVINDGKNNGTVLDKGNNHLIAM